MNSQRDLILKSFLIESEEGLSLMEQSVLKLESTPDDAELVQTIFLVIHTMKGNASVLDLNSLLEFTHSIEDLLDTVRSGQTAVTPDIIGLLFSLIDALRDMVAAAGEGINETTSRALQLLARIGGHLYQAAAEPSPITNEKDADTAISRVAVEFPAAASGTVSAKTARTLRVDVEKLDRLLNLASEITIARGRVAEMLEGKGEINRDDIREAHSLVDTLHFELQETILKARMVQLGPLFGQYNRTVRDQAHSQGKLAELRTEGDEVEVDTSVVEHLKDPLLHMLRNALDHGIESPDIRAQHGKPRGGTITIAAAHQSGNVLIEVSDDGAGLDRQRIIEVARKKGLITGPEKLSDHDIYQLIFEPGFSTAGTVSHLSGRGVGMDVVRRNVHALRGGVHITSEPGMGSTVHIRLPLTLAIIEGFGVGVGGETYVIPVDQIVECIELPRDEQDSARREGVLQVRNEPLPFVYLKDHFGLSGERGQRQTVVVVRHDGGRAGLAVDELYGATQTVIKPLPGIFKNIPGVSGSAILGNGRVALILDIPALLRNFEIGTLKAI